MVVADRSERECEFVRVTKSEKVPPPLAHFELVRLQVGHKESTVMMSTIHFEELGQVLHFHCRTLAIYVGLAVGRHKKTGPNPLMVGGFFSSEASPEGADIGDGEICLSCGHVPIHPTFGLPANPFLLLLLGSLLLG